MSDPPHRCARFRAVRRPGPWRTAGPLQERDVERVSLCSECGKERGGRFRKIVAVERQAVSPSVGQADAGLRQLARRVLARAQGRRSLRADPLVRALGGVRAESDLERLAALGSIGLEYRPKTGSLSLHAVHILAPETLAETARPGDAARRHAALAEARRRTSGLLHPQSQLVAEVLAGEDAPALGEPAIRALAGLALLVEAGDVRPARLFSTEVLGDSKQLSRLRSRLERLVGPLERLGIRDHGTLVLLGGRGTIRLGGAELDVGRLRTVGLAQEDVLAIDEVRVPPVGLVVVENLTPFQACCERLRAEALVLWSAGFPSRAVVAFTSRVAAAGARVRVWCDLDLGGVRIARQFIRLTGGKAEPVLMDPDRVRRASVRRALQPSQRRLIARDLECHPGEPLAATLTAILESNAWVEQEGLIDAISELAGV
jgi:hypothetical protein